jgi:hypothetical protein
LIIGALRASSLASVLRIEGLLLLGWTNLSLSRLLLEACYSNKRRERESFVQPNNNRPSILKTEANKDARKAPMIKQPSSNT